MQNFIADTSGFTGTTVRLEGEEHHHATRSSRVRIGELIGVTDGHGRRVEARIETIDSRMLTAVIERDVSGAGEPPVEITMALALIKPARFEMAVEKCTELGARQFMPLIAERCMVDPVRFRLDRLERIIREAVKQSGRSWIPGICDAVPVQKLAESTDGRLFSAYRSAKISMADALQRAGDSRKYVIAVGPEGDFTDEEIACLIAGGATLFTLGGLTLRSETAAITACAYAAKWKNQQ